MKTMTTTESDVAQTRKAPVLRDWQGKVLKPGTKAYIREEERQEARKRLKELGVKPGATIYTRLIHVSRSGMFRLIGVHVVHKGELVDITYWVNQLLDYGIDRDRGGLRVGGCGMDMGFHVAYSLSRSMFPKGWKCIGKKCRANDHFNGDRDYSGKSWHRDGGYALKHQWM